MSKRCELQKEYYQANGNYKGNGKYKDEYVSWLEEQILALRIHDVSGSLPSLMKIYMNANSMKYQDFVEWIRNYNGNDH